MLRRVAASGGCVAGCGKKLRKVRSGIEAMLYPTATHIVLQVKNVVEGSHQIADVLRRGPFLLVKLNDPVQHLRGIVHLCEREPMLRRAIVIDRSPSTVQLPVSPSFRQRLTEKPIQNIEHLVEGVLIRFGHASSLIGE